MAEKTHGETIYCGALRKFAKTSRFRPEFEQNAKELA
jgi:hypothetical protein